MSTWVVIANSSFAEIYSIDKRELLKIHEIDNPDGRLKSGEILQDRPGRCFEGRGSQNSTKHAYSSEVNAHVHVQQMFAHKIAEVLRRAKGANTFDTLDIIAPPQFLGELRKVLPENVRQCVRNEINKEIPPGFNETEKLDAIRKYLDLKRPVTAR